MLQHKEKCGRVEWQRWAAMQLRRLQLRHATCCCSSCLGNFTCQLRLLPLSAKCYKSRISTAVATYSPLCAPYSLCLKEMLKHARTHSIISAHRHGNTHISTNSRCCCCMPQLKHCIACVQQLLLLQMLFCCSAVLLLPAAWLIICLYFFFFNYNWMFFRCAD